MLCEKCNKERGNDFEDEYLAVNIQELSYHPNEISLDMLEDLLRLFLLLLKLNEEGTKVSEETYCSIIKSDDIETDHYMYNMVQDIYALLVGENTNNQVKLKRNMLKFRWGMYDTNIHSVKETCNKFNKKIEYYVKTEMFLLRQLGFISEKRYRESEEYYNLSVSLDGYKYK